MLTPARHASRYARLRRRPLYFEAQLSPLKHDLSPFHFLRYNATFRIMVGLAFILAALTRLHNFIAGQRSIIEDVSHLSCLRICERKLRLDTDDELEAGRASAAVVMLSAGHDAFSRVAYHF